MRKEELNVSAQSRKYGKNTLSVVQLKKVFHILLRLRQCCAHPQIGGSNANRTSGLVSLSKHTMTLTELTLAVLRDARVKKFNGVSILHYMV